MKKCSYKVDIEEMYGIQYLQRLVVKTYATKHIKTCRNNGLCNHGPLIIITTSESLDLAIFFDIQASRDATAVRQTRRLMLLSGKGLS